MNDIVGLLYVTLGGLLDGHGSREMVKVVMDNCASFMDGETVTRGIDLWECLWDIHNRL